MALSSATGRVMGLVGLRRWVAAVGGVVGLTAGLTLASMGLASGARAAGAPPVKPVAVVYNANGLPRVFDVIHGQVFYADAVSGSPGGVTGWGPWIAMDASIGRVSAITAGIDKNGGTELFAVNTAGQIYGRSTAGPSATAALADWTPWQSFDGSLSSISVVRYLDGRLEMFGTNSNGVVFHRGQWPNALSWSPWEQMAGSLKDVSAAINTDGRVELFGVNSDNVIFERTQNAPQTDSWGDWQVVPGSLVNVSATTDATGRIEMLGTNSDGVVFHRNQTAPATDTWTDWAVFPGAVLSYTAAMRSALPQTTGNTVGQYMFGINNANGYMYYTYKGPGQTAFDSFTQVGRVMRDIVPGINIYLDTARGCVPAYTVQSCSDPNGAIAFHVNTEGDLEVAVLQSDTNEYADISVVVQYDFEDPTRFRLASADDPSRCLTWGLEFRGVTVLNYPALTQCEDGSQFQEFWAL